MVLSVGKINSSDTVLLAGAGEDLSFDIELSRITACKTIILDPTPKSIKHWENIIESYKTGCSFSINNNDDEIYNFENFNQSRFTFLQKSTLGGKQKYRDVLPRNPEFVRTLL